MHTHTLLSPSPPVSPSFLAPRQFFKALLERGGGSGHDEKDGGGSSACGGGGGLGSTVADASLLEHTAAPAAPTAAVPTYVLGGMSGATLALVLEWVYCDMLPRPLPGHYCTTAGSQTHVPASLLLFVF